jgi:hypothetical protein
MKRSAAFFCLVTALCLLTCVKKDNPVSPNDTGDPGLTYRMTYTISNDSIFLTYMQRITTKTFCFDDSLITRIDTLFDDGPFGRFFQLLNNDKLLVLEEFDTLVRSGTGTGLQGEWVGFNRTVRIDATSYTDSLNQPQWADMFYPTSSDNVPGLTVVKISENKIRLTGNITGEVVTVTFSNLGNQTYSSSNPAHATGTWYRNPSSCPNIVPSWYDNFLSLNGLLIKKAVH